MAEDRTEQSSQEALRRYLTASTEASGVPLHLDDEATLLDVAHWLSEARDD